MLNDSSTASLYKCLNVSNYAKVAVPVARNVTISPSTSLVSSTGDSSTCQDDSVTIDGNDSTYYESINDVTYESYFKHRKNVINKLGSETCRGKICKNCDKLMRQVTNLKEQLYCDWNNRIKPLHDSIAVKQDIIDCYKKQIECYKLELDKSREEISELKDRLKFSQQLIEQNINAVKLKQQECDNTKILLESALNSLNIERYNVNNHSCHNKHIKSHKIEPKNMSNIANNTHDQYGNVCGELVSKSSTRYATRRNIGDKKNSHCKYSESVDLEIFN